MGQSHATGADFNSGTKPVGTGGIGLSGIYGAQTPRLRCTVNREKETPEMIDILRSTYPEVDFSLCAPIGEHAGVLQAMALAALDVAGLSVA